MYKLLIILILSFGILSCSDTKTLDELREIKIGLTEKEVLYLLGDPYEVELEVEHEEWKYLYESKSRFKNYFVITIINEKVTSFTSY